MGKEQEEARQGEIISGSSTTSSTELPSVVDDQEYCMANSDDQCWPNRKWIMLKNHDDEYCCGDRHSTVDSITSRTNINNNKRADSTLSTINNNINRKTLMRSYCWKHQGGSSITNIPCILLTILLLLLSFRNYNTLLYNSNHPPTIFQTVLANTPSLNYINQYPTSSSAPVISSRTLQQQQLDEGIDCSYFSNNNNPLSSCNSLPTEQSTYSTSTIRLTGGIDAIYATAHQAIRFPPSSPSNNNNNLIPHNETSYCFQVQKWLDMQSVDYSIDSTSPLSQTPSLCSQLFCNPGSSPPSSNLLIIQEIFGNLSRSVSENSFFPSAITTQFSIKLTLENSTIDITNDGTEKLGWITMNISQLTKLFNYCHYCKVGNPSFEPFKKERESNQCTLPFSMNKLKSQVGSSDTTEDETCGQKGYSLPLLNSMVYSSLNDHKLLYYFPYRVCYCYQSSSFSSRCDEWSDLYYTDHFQNGIRGMFIGLYLIQLVLIILIVFLPLLYKHVRMGSRSSLARITTDTSSTQDLQGRLTFDENSYSFKLISETTPRKQQTKSRSRANSGAMSVPAAISTTADNPSSDSEDGVSSTCYRYETSHHATSNSVDQPKPEDDTPLLDLSRKKTKNRRKTWKNTFKSLGKSIFDFRIIATIISITNLIAGFLSLIPTLPYDARLVLISITCVLSLMGLIPIVFQWLVVLRKIDSQDPTSHSGKHIKILSGLVFTSTLLLFVGYMLTVMFVNGYSNILLARYIMLVVLFLYFIICFPLLVGYGVKVYFRVLKNNNEIRFFQFKFTKYLLFESLTYLYFTIYTIYFIVSYPFFLTTFNNIGDRFMTVYPWSITHIFIILSHCNRFYFLSDWSFIKLFYLNHLFCCFKKKKRRTSSTFKPIKNAPPSHFYEHQRKISSASTSSSTQDESSLSY